ncbi:unnamed protein product [Trichobilharzia regenti]|nr:unnamed protein product [Trichobilharzia regenti]
MRVADMSQDTLDSIKKFKFRKCNNTIEDTTLESLKDALPSHQPRYVLLSYRFEKHDGRVSFPYCLLFSTPQGIFIISVDFLFVLDYILPFRSRKISHVSKITYVDKCWKGFSCSWGDFVSGQFIRNDATPQVNKDIGASSYSAFICF